MLRLYSPPHRLSGRICVWAIGPLRFAAPVEAQQDGARAPGIPELEARARADSNDATVHYALAMAYWDKKQWDAADSALQEAVHLAPDYADAWLALSQLPFRRGEGYWKKIQKSSGDTALDAMLYESNARYRRAFLLNPLVDLGILGKFEGPEGMAIPRRSIRSGHPHLPPRARIRSQPLHGPRAAGPHVRATRSAGRGARGAPTAGSMPRRNGNSDSSSHSGTGSIPGCT